MELNTMPFDQDTISDVHRAFHYCIDFLFILFLMTVKGQEIINSIHF
jgi:hypothetical protein